MQQAYKDVGRLEIRNVISKERFRLPIASGVPQAFVTMIMRCWAFAPGERFVQLFGLIR